MTWTPLLAQVGRDCTAGVVVSLASIAFYVSVATLIFQGPLAIHLPSAIGAALLSAAVTAQTSVGSALPTAVASLVVTSLAVGVVWWVLGRYRAGDLIRYIPYPVIGGFLGAVGWMLMAGGVAVALGRPLDLADLREVAPIASDPRLISGLLLSALIGWMTTRFRHVLALPGAIVLGMLLVHAGLQLAGIGLDSARQSGWLLQPFGTAWPAWPWSGPSLAAVDIPALLMNAGLILSAVLAATVSLMLSTTSLEVAWESRADLNRDLQVLGRANVLAALGGGLVGSISINQSLLNRQAGALGRTSGLAKAGLCLLAMVWGGPVMALVPRPLLGALLLCLGIGMLKTWLVDSRRQLPWRDYLTVLAIVGTTALIGLLPAVFVGVLACCLEFAVSSARQTPVRRIINRSGWPTRVERSPERARFLHRAGDRMTIVELQGVLFFSSVTRLTRDLAGLLESSVRPARVLFDFRRVSWVDTSASHALMRLFQSARGQGIEIELSALSAKVHQALNAASGAQSVRLRQFPDIDAAVNDWDEACLLHDDVPERSLEARLAAALPAGVGIERLTARFESIRLAPGDQLFCQGDPSDALYLVHTGRLGAFVQLHDSERAVRTILPGSVIGEMGLLRQQARSATVRAEQDSIVLRLSDQALQDMTSVEPELAAALYRWFLHQLADRIDQLTAQTSAQMQ